MGPADFSPLEANLASRSFWGPQQVVGRERAQCLAYLIQADWERLGAEWEPPSLGVRLVSDHPGSQQHAHWPHTEPGPPAQDGRQPAHRLAPV